MSKQHINPFVCQGYIGSEYFCDRANETEKLLSSLYNGRNVTLISPRRLGKTGLIWHAFERIRAENRDAICVYIDIFPTKSQSEMVRMLGEAILNASMSKGRQLGKRVLEAIGGLRPVLGFDPLTGLPSVSLSVDATQSQTTLLTLFDYMKRQRKEFFLAIDEFQQITEYPETGTEALLRSHIQFTPNIHFVFSGSKQHLMSEMFAAPQRPFYQSTDIVNLPPLEEEEYYRFANRFFAARRGQLSRDVFHDLYASFEGYTWYIQSILNRWYEAYRKVDSLQQLRTTVLSVVASKAPQYEALVQLLTDNQFTLLRAIASEGLVEQPLGRDFIGRYRLAGASSVKTALDMLTDKELVYRQPAGYTVYDRFMALWLKRL